MSDQTAPTYLEPIRDELDRLRAKTRRLLDEWGTALVIAEGYKDRAEKAEADLEQAEQRINDLLTRLDDRSAALNRTGASNDTMRATLARVEQFAKSYAFSAHALGRTDDERRWLDLLAILERGIPTDQEAAK